MIWLIWLTCWSGRKKYEQEPICFLTPYFVDAFMEVWLSCKCCKRFNHLFVCFVSKFRTTLTKLNSYYACFKISFIIRLCILALNETGSLNLKIGVHGLLRHELQKMLTIPNAMDMMPKRDIYFLATKFSNSTTQVYPMLSIKPETSSTGG